jgi:hypothetical protein
MLQLSQMRRRRSSHPVREPFGEMFSPVPSSTWLQRLYRARELRVGL